MESSRVKRTAPLVSFVKPRAYLRPLGSRMSIMRPTHLMCLHPLCYFFGIMTQTPSSPEEYSTLIKVLLRPTLSIRYPTSAQLYAFHRANGIVRPIPDSSELQVIAARKVMRMQARPQQPVLKAPGASPSVLADEARIREMKGSEVVVLAEKLGLKFERHAINNGLTCMRARNCLYSFIRGGGSLPS